MQHPRRSGNGRGSTATDLGGPEADWYNGGVVFSVLWARVNGLSGSLLDAEAEAEEFHRRVAAGKPVARSLAAALLGRAALSRGHVQRARYFLSQAVLRGRACGAQRLPVWPLAALAQSAALAGDPAAAEKALGEAEHLAPWALPPHAVDLALARAWVVASRREVGRAARLALAAAGEADDAGRREGAAFAGLALHEATRLGASPSPIGWSTSPPGPVMSYSGPARSTPWRSATVTLSA
jgi:hypothetical protein